MRQPETPPARGPRRPHSVPAPIGKAPSSAAQKGFGGGGGGRGKTYGATANGSPGISSLEVDNEGRPYDLTTVVVNFVNVGTTYGKKFGKGESSSPAVFHWEGVRRCVRNLTRDLGLKVIGVIFENWKGTDETEGMPAPRTVEGIPADIREMCEFIEETPRAPGMHQRSADDEMTIKCAYRRNCRIVDNDNYKDWQKVLRNEKMRAWLEHSQDRVHMKYYFDSGLRCFETLEGNAMPVSQGKAADHWDAGAGKPGASNWWGKPSGPRGVQSGKGTNRRSSLRTGASCYRSPDMHGVATSARTMSAVPRTPPDATHNMPQGERVCVTPPDPTGLFTGQHPSQVQQRVLPAKPWLRTPQQPTVGEGLPRQIAAPQKLPNATVASVGAVGSTFVALPGAHAQFNGGAPNGAWTPLCAAVYNSDLAQVTNLLRNGADPNQSIPQGGTPLAFAVMNCSRRLVYELVRHGADPAQARGPDGENIRVYLHKRILELRHPPEREREVLTLLGFSNISGGAVACSANKRAHPASVVNEKGVVVLDDDDDEPTGPPSKRPRPGALKAGRNWRARKRRQAELRRQGLAGKTTALPTSVRRQNPSAPHASLRWKVMRAVGTPGEAGAPGAVAGSSLSVSKPKDSPQELRRRLMELNKRADPMARPVPVVPASTDPYGGSTPQGAIDLTEPDTKTPPSVTKVAAAAFAATADPYM